MADFSSYIHKFRARGDGFQAAGVNKVAKRNRQAVSCVSCRSRKLKCDRGHPCETCVKRGDEQSCSYGGLISNSTAAKTITSFRRNQAQDRLRNLENLVMEMMNSGHSEKPRSPTAASTSGAANTPDAALIPNGGHLRFEAGESRYTGSTHWSAILDNINEIKTAFTSDDASVEFEGPDKEPLDPDILLAPSQPPSLERILQQSLPPRVEVDRRLSTYFNAKYLVIPLIHTNQFQRQYDQFWRTPLETSPLWVAILFSIICISATLNLVVGLEPPTSADTPPARDVFLAASAQCLLLGGYTRPKKHVVEALLLYSRCKYMATMDPSREASIVLSILIRLAYRMGYHRDPDNFSHFSKFEGELRRRAWAMCQQFDLMMSFQLGLPSNIPPDSYDTKSPRNLLDADFDEHMSELPLSRPEKEPTQILYFIVKSRIMTVFAKICSQALTFAPISRQDIMDLDCEMRQAYSTVPDVLRARPMAQSFADPGYVIMVRLNIEFLVQKSLLVLHRTRMTQSFQDSRTACQDAAVSILRNLIDLHEEFQPGGQLYSDRWMLSSFNMNDFALAAMVMCLLICTSKETKPSQSHLDMLKQAHHVCADIGATSKEARRVADALGVMLSKLGQNLGPKRSKDLVLTPLSLHESNRMSEATKPPPQPDLSVPLLPDAPGDGNGSPDLLESMLDGNLDFDWVAFDQYLSSDMTYENLSDGRPSTPYRFLGPTTSQAAD